MYVISKAIVNKNQVIEEVSILDFGFDSTEEAMEYIRSLEKYNSYDAIGMYDVKVYRPNGYYVYYEIKGVAPFKPEPKITVKPARVSLDQKGYATVGDTVEFQMPIYDEKGCCKYDTGVIRKIDGAYIMIEVTMHDGEKFIAERYPNEIVKVIKNG